MIVLAFFIVAVGVPAFAFNSTCYQPPFFGTGGIGPVDPNSTPCSQSTDDNEASACCGYSDGSICLSNGLCFVPASNTMQQGSCTDPTWGSDNCPNFIRSSSASSSATTNASHCVGMYTTLCVTLMECNVSTDTNLHICDSTWTDTPSPGDAKGQWYCGGGTPNPTSCSDAETKFGIQPGFLADHRNSSSSSSATATVTVSTTVVPSACVTADAGREYPSATANPSISQISCPSHAGSEAGIGAGIGIPLFIALIGALAFAFNERRRLKQLRGELNRESNSEWNVDNQRTNATYAANELPADGAKPKELPS